MGSATLDATDRGLIHALQLDGRAPFARIAAVLGVSEQTVARRYRRLVAGGVIRVVGGVDGALLGYEPWTVRVRCTPDAGPAIAEALARRPDAYWVHLLSGGTEISCFTQSPDPVLLERLPRTARVLGMTAHLLLRGFALPDGWPGLAALTPEQADELRPPPAERREIVLKEEDHRLAAVLARDGRAGHAELAAATGWSEATVKRRLALLRASGAVNVQLDYSPRLLGYRSEARLWMSVRPSALLDVATTLAGHPEIAFAAVTTGPANLLATALCRDSAALYRYLTERVSALDAVQTLETAPVLRTMKRTGALPPLSYGRPA
ncbi:AsnC family transcriptional regulator [Nonomuraea sp. FMUSA5-5]|uniref:AsnC family transcriptional regulator n=1 Tax=Nonomuraea composti TaxID=2720023 RepID=A0ABX1AUK7_9ACTN|nr:AsnC family transcriptional regulator [Nonomuraea sp. FMUSA5-5]NJP89318.1 AsnC family transcriptional regulator [Nonomuraea sp. FMUSA5-5]